jgi:DNA-binding PadR family transcriptional regulator
MPFDVCAPSRRQYRPRRCRLKPARGASLYPLLHGMEKKGLLRSETRPNERRPRRVYMATAKGRAALARAKERVWELFGELFELERSPKQPKTR